MSQNILVIGSKEHKRATSVNWLEPFPNIEDFDSLIINMQSLSQEQYVEIYEKIVQMKEQISSIINSDREIFCIISEPIFHPTFISIVQPSNTLYQPHIPNNYDWVPVPIKLIKRKEAISKQLLNQRFQDYFNLVGEWNFEIEIDFEDQKAFLPIWIYNISPIAINKSRKTIAGTIDFTGILRQGLKGKKGAIHFLPLATKCSVHQSIEILLDIISGKAEKYCPPWRNNIEIPNINNFESDIQLKIKEIENIQKEIFLLRKECQKLDTYRDLLCATGDDLEFIVQKALFDLGIKTKKAKSGFHVDLISKTVAVEITGIKGTVGTGTRKVNQTGLFNQHFRKNEKIVLIVNTQMDIEPKKRNQKNSFSLPVLRYFEAMGVCCLTSLTLYQLWKDVKVGKFDGKKVKEKMLNTNGELTISVFR